MGRRWHRIDYIKIIEDLNADILTQFGVSPIENQYGYSYMSTGAVDKIFFYGIEIFDSEQFHIEEGRGISDYSFWEFEDYLEEKVMEIGINFLKYSFYPA